MKLLENVNTISDERVDHMHDVKCIHNCHYILSCVVLTKYIEISSLSPVVFSLGAHASMQKLKA